MHNYKHYLCLKTQSFILCLGTIPMPMLGKGPTSSATHCYLEGQENANRAPSEHRPNAQPISALSWQHKFTWRHWVTDSNPRSGTTSALSLGSALQVGLFIAGERKTPEEIFKTANCLWTSSYSRNGEQMGPRTGRWMYNLPCRACYIPSSKPLELSIPDCHCMSVQDDQCWEFLTYCCDKNVIKLFLRFPLPKKHHGF